MKTPARLRLWVVAALAFAVAAGMVWWASDRVRGTVRLPDGREVTVLAVTYGTDHALIEGPFWAKVARRFLSRAKAYQLGLRIYERKFDQPTLIVWTHWRLPSTNEAPRYASVRDRHGVESEPEHVAVDAPVGKTRTAIMAWQFTNFPRRQGHFPIRFYERQSGQLQFIGGRLQFLGQADVPNAARVDATTAPAPSPPVTVKQEDVEFTLTMLRSGGEKATNLVRPYIQVAKWTEARFEIREGGRLATNWTVRGLRAVGETGNRFQLFYGAALSTNGDYRVSFPDALWPDESGWRIRGEFAHGSGFVETNRWKFKGLPVARYWSGFTTNLEETAFGVRFISMDIRPTTQFTRYVRGGFRRTTDLTVQFSPESERSHPALVAAVDGQGRELRFSGADEPIKGRYVVGLEIPTNSTALDLTFVVHQSRDVEFFVKPDWVSTNMASTFLPRGK